MTNHEAMILLERLLEGIHPITGEILSDNHVCNHPQVLRALYKAINALKNAELPAPVQEISSSKRTQQSKGIRQKSWTEDEDTYLRNAYTQDVILSEICAELHRSEQQIKFRLVYLGLSDRSILNNSLYPETGYAYQGLPWYPEEEAKLTNLYNSGCTPKKMASEMKRSVHSIMCRLERLGLIKSRYEYKTP